MKLLFKTGPLFYLFFNARLTAKLLFCKADLFFSNDLDTLLPNYLVSRLKHKPLIYDSHEIFCEVPELQTSPFKKKIWLALEKRIVPRLKFCITVNDSIASYFNARYGTAFSVVRNIPPNLSIGLPKSREQLNLPNNKSILILQGAGINIQRGAEELLDAMHYLDGVYLLVIGSGDVWSVLEKKAEQLTDKVRLIRKLPKEELFHYTANSDIGLSIDKNTNLNYQYSLPNKVFDYLHAGIPILATRLPEIERLISGYHVGEFITSHVPEQLAENIQKMLNSPNLPTYRKNAQRAAVELNWEKEQLTLLNVIRMAGNEAKQE